ncbi:hypothetical protein GBAR_LOCUS31267 [Geodia barretti]|uniref:ZU5 domain-containing protein n=1 Tax=Geodia barretti TaxID=519541 RepID=A0AA35U0G1_GEOBA|nr:hypothetical protein GBAR_LOCUS31267 [Geodia barretti]
MYDYLSDTWTITSQMKNQRSECLAVTLPHHRLVVLGGYTKRDVDPVEIMSLGHHRPFKIVPSEADVFYNQREQTAVASEFCTLPQHFTLISTLSHCTSEGRMFTDEANDFSLEIPEGAIPEGERLTVDVAVSLFSPFQFPEGLRPVSPVFWVCVREQRNFQFSKPVLVTIPHFLNIEDDDDITSLGLTFLKADHNKNSEGLYEFKQTPGEMDLKTTKRLGVIKMSHFCSLCLASKDIPKCLEKASFCITAVLPIFSVPVGKRAQAHFFITFLNLKTCLNKVKDIIRNMNLEGYCTKRRKFQFKPSTTAAIEIVISNPCCGMIGLDGSKKIFRSEVDFFVKRRLSQGELECLKSDDFYPPRFDVFFASFQENATLSDGKIAFRGATSDIEFNIHLDLPHPRTRPVASHAPTTETRDIGSQTEELPVGNSVASQLASGSNVHECSDAPPNLFPASISHKTGRLGNL